MRCITKPAPRPGLSVASLPEPECRAHEVLIQVHHAGMCGTDLHIAEWDAWAQGRLHPPLIVGHEFAGEIVEVGTSVGDAFRPGQLVTAEGHIICGHCRQCRTGNGHVCRNTSIIGVDQDGAFAEFIAMPATNVMALDGIPTHIGAIMDPMGNAFHTVLTAPVVAATVLIVGCGPIGCFAVAVAKAAGASRVIAADLNQTRLNLATTMGADAAINPNHEDLTEAVMELTGGDGVDVACEMSGHPTGLRQALASVTPGGRVQLLGLPEGDVTLAVSRDIIFKGITMYGVIGRRMYKTWHDMQRFLSTGLVDPTPVITHVIPLERVDDALAVIRSGEAGKVILSVKDV